MFGICQFPLHLSGILPFTFFNFALHVNLLLKIPDILEMFVKIPKKGIYSILLVRVSRCGICCGTW